MTTEYNKSLLAMRYYLHGSQYFMALRALEYSREIHCNTRKNGDPEFSHQVFIGNYIRTLLPNLLHKEETITAAFLHDTCEDYNIGFDEIEAQFGQTVAKSVRLLTKKFRGYSIPYDVYFRDISEDPIASVVKGADRCHNVMTMHSAKWTKEKQYSYLEEVDHWFLPMLKTARRKFPQQEAIYENIKLFLKVQAAQIRLMLENGG